MLWNRIKARMHKWHVAEGLRAIRRWLADWDAMDANRSLLSPKILSPNSENSVDQYRYAAVRELRNAIDSDGCNNIAITGVYGSGKSSVIQTFLAELNPFYRKRKVLNISLSNFIDAEIAKGNSTVEYENEIEQKVFQHILYKTNQNKTQQTKISRISHISQSRGIFIAVSLLLCVFCAIYLFFPSWLNIGHLLDWCRDVFSVETRHTIRKWGELLSVIYLAGYIVYSIVFIIRRLQNIRFNGTVEAKGAQITWKFESSTFNEMLEEILYFFKAGGYRIVLFEDLDRIKTPERLFLKLREINTLLNESDYYKRHGRSIKFVYAIRDEIFDTDIRTKCFDYIISVVPVVDKYNAGDYLIKQYHGEGEIMSQIPERDLSVIGMYVEGKRELANVVNEYALSYKAFIHDTSETKLLAILVYKSQFPIDYAAAYKKEGCLYAMFSDENKKYFYDPLIADMEQKERALDKQIEKNRDEIRGGRSKVVGILAHEGIGKLYIGSDEYELNEFIKNAHLYDALVNNRITEYCVANSNEPEVVGYDKKFRELVDEAYPDGEYDELMNEAHTSLQQNLSARNELHNQIEVIKNKKLSGLIKLHKADAVQQIMQSIVIPIYEKRFGKENIDNYREQISQQIKFLQIFIREEYIAEDYTAYMSHSYPGSLTERDIKFLNAVLQGERQEYGYELTNCEGIVARLKSENFEHESVLNFYLVDYLIDKKRSASIKQVVELARKHPDFVIQYDSKGKYGKHFTGRIFTKWQGAVTQLMEIANQDEQVGMFKLFWREAPYDVRLSDGERGILCDMFEYISDSRPTADLMEMIDYYGLKFNNIKSPSKDGIYDFIVKNHHFAITLENLRVIYGESFDKAAFTQIYTQREEIRTYLINDPGIVLGFVPQTSVEETPETIVKLLNNPINTEDKLVPYIISQKCQIDLNGVKFEFNIPSLLKANKIRPTWENVEICYGWTKDTEALLSFVTFNVDALKEQSCDGAKAYEIEKWLLIETEQISNEEFDKLSSCFQEPLGASLLSEMSEDKVRKLKNHNLLYFDVETIELVHSKSDSLFAEYLQANFEEFMAMDEDDVPVSITNSIGIRILNSSMTLNEKMQYMSRYPVDVEDENVGEYARLYCFYANENGHFEEMNMDELLVAMNAYKDTNYDAWKTKISIINQINRTIPYDRDLETDLINTLGDFYAQLNKFGYHTPKFDNNPENEELLSYLKGLKGKHYVSDFKPAMFNKLKVSMKHKEF